MPKVKKLRNFFYKIEALYKRTVSMQSAFEELKRSHHVTTPHPPQKKKNKKNLKDLNAYVEKHSSKHKRYLSKQDERTVALKASNSTKVSHNLKMKGN